MSSNSENNLLYFPKKKKLVRAELVQVICQISVVSFFDKHRNKQSHGFVFILRVLRQGGTSTMH